MSQDPALIRSRLRSLVGRKVTAITRVFFEHSGTVKTDEGPLQLTLDNGDVVLFESGSNGEDLVIEDNPWIDPFEGKLTSENRDFVATSGKWSLFDVSGFLPYRLLIGPEVRDVREVDFESQARFEGYPVDRAVREGWKVDLAKIVGTEILVGDHILRVESIMDDIRVNVRTARADAGWGGKEATTGPS